MHGGFAVHDGAFPLRLLLLAGVPAVDVVHLPHRLEALQEIVVRQLRQLAARMLLLARLGVRLVEHAAQKRLDERAQRPFLPFFLLAVLIVVLRIVLFVN